MWLGLVVEALLLFLEPPQRPPYTDYTNDCKAQIRGRARAPPLLQTVQAGSVDHPEVCRLLSGAFSPWTAHSLPTSAEVRNEWSCTFTPHIKLCLYYIGRDSAVGTAIRYGLDGPGIESRWGSKISRTFPDRSWGSPGLLYNEYHVSFTGVKRPGRGVDHPPPSSAEVGERVQLYFYSPSGPSLPVVGWTLSLLLLLLLSLSLSSSSS